MTGHVHAESMTQYAEDAHKVPRPWDLWEVSKEGGGWVGCFAHPCWWVNCEYRRKPQMMKATCADGTEVEWPSPLMSAPDLGTVYYYPRLDEVNAYMSCEWYDDPFDRTKLAAGLVHLSEEAALEHSIAVLQLSRGGSR